MISYIKDKRLWVIETNNIGYAFGFTESGLLVNSYFGKKLPYISDYPEARDSKEWASFTPKESRAKEEYLVWGSNRFTEPCLKLIKNNIRDSRLVYQGFEIKKNFLKIRVDDDLLNYSLYLNYIVYEEEDIIERYIEITNKDKESLLIEQIYSGAIYPEEGNDYNVTYLCGKWAGENQITKTKISKGKFILESRRGFTSHHHNPFIAIDKNATEDYGEVYYLALGYSGNWKIVVEQDVFNQIKVSAGINEFDFSYKLDENKSFITPSIYISFTDKGYGDITKKYHSFILNRILPKPFNTQVGKVLYNSWEATQFNVNEENQIKLAEIASKIGVELFVMDDGWFGDRNSDNAGLGDWYINKNKFPQGLKNLIKRVNDLNMEFGLWIEPEMVNRNSNLYRKHPDWIYHFEGVPSTELRNQLVLNCAREDVRNFIFETVNDLLINNNIKFIKWDLNRAITEPGYPEIESIRQKEVWLRHIYGIYSIVDELKKKHPSVIFQTCSGGGGRIDLGILRYFDQAWVSDNTDAIDRLYIQNGFSYLYPAKIMESWVTDEVNWLTKRKISMKFRFHVSMAGCLGIGDNLLKWGQNEIEEAKYLVSLYKSIRHIIHFGDLYRIIEPDGKYCAFNYVSKDKSEAVLFFFLISNNYGDDVPLIKFKGLNENYVYHNLETNEIKSGAAFMNVGFRPDVKSEIDSVIYRLKRI